MEGTPRSRTWTPALVAAWTMLAALVGGCAGPIYKPQDPRSQFERVDALRDRSQPAEIEDEYGRVRPNLSGRLLGTR